jgi:two-component system, sensor histidine kinase
LARNKLLGLVRIFDVVEDLDVNRSRLRTTIANAGFSRGFGGLGITAPPLWLVVVLPLAYVAAASLSLYTFGANTPIWVSNAFAVTALLRNKRSTWPVLLFLSAVADFAGNAVADGWSPVVLGIGACDTFEILLVATLAGPEGVASPADSIWSLARLALVCLIVPMMSAAGGVSLLHLVSGAPFLDYWKTWYLADACGLLTITPLLLSWTDQARQPDRSRNAIGQTIILSLLVAAVGYVDFNDAVPGLFLTFPFLLLAAFNGRLLGATTAAAALAAVAIGSTWEGHGSFAIGPAANDVVAKVQMLQLYIVVVLLSSLPVAAVLDQREKLTAQLRETTRAAQAAARAKSEFVAVMSHEIRTPMTGVLGMADLLMNADLPAKEREYVAGIRASGRHLLVLINDILDFSRIEAGKLDLETIDFGIPEVMEQVRSLLAPQAAERGLDLGFELDPDLPPMLRGDPTRLKQVLVNLVGNGLKFTHRGGVTIAVCHRASPNGPVRVRFEVKDTGIGIPAEKQTILFDAFSQADSSTTRQYGGSGLGLAICRQLVAAMGGEIGVESVTGLGSLFWFEIPMQPSDNTARPAAAGNVVAGPPRRVLLVEDVELNQVLIAEMLRAYGHEVTLAVNGKEAVALAAREHFDLVLMDVQMPVMDGVEATRRIRGLPPPFGEVPVLALSANVIAAERERCLAAGMNFTLTKPVDWPQLFEAMARYGGPGKDAANDHAADVPGRTAAPRAATSIEADSPIDAAVLDKLRHLQGGTGDLTVKLAEIFTRDTGRRLDELRAAVKQADAASVARMAHAIKGSAANLGAHVMVRICAGIEVRAEQADLDTIPARIDELQREFMRACDALAAKRSAA